MADFTNDPKIARRRARMQQQFEEREEQAKRELAEFFKEHQQELAQEFLEVKNSGGTGTDPRLARVQNGQSAGFGGFIDGSDD